MKALHLSIDRIAVIGVCPASLIHGMKYSMPYSLSVRLIASITHQSSAGMIDEESLLFICQEEKSGPLCTDSSTF